MNKIVSALNFLDDELIVSAFESMETESKTANSSTQRRANTFRLYPKRWIAAFVSLLLVVCLTPILYFTLIIGSDPSHSVDLHAHGAQKILTDFSDISAYYPDARMFNRLASLDLITPHKEGTQLYYVEDTDWRDSTNWNSLLLFGEIAGTNNFSILYCLFEGTLEYWIRARPVYKNNIDFITIGDTQIWVVYRTTRVGEIETYESYAIFESNDVVYELCLENDFTNSNQMAILNTLLN